MSCVIRWQNGWLHLAKTGRPLASLVR